MVTSLTWFTRFEEVNSGNPAWIPRQLVEEDYNGQ
jgi:hypothetical protein